jgi:hypothetical protein
MPVQQELQPLDANQNNKIENSHDNRQQTPQISQPVRQIFVLYWTTFFETNDFKLDWAESHSLHADICRKRVA